MPYFHAAVDQDSRQKQIHHHSTLLEHPRTAEATSVAPGHWRITVSGDVRSAVPELASAFVAARIPILSIAPQSQDLESLFESVNEHKAWEAGDAA